MEKMETRTTEDIPEYKKGDKAITEERKTLEKFAQNIRKQKNQRRNNQNGS